MLPEVNCLNPKFDRVSMNLCWVRLGSLIERCEKSEAFPGWLARSHELQARESLKYTPFLKKRGIPS
jgi:hypothetical protein